MKKVQTNFKLALGVMAFVTVLVACKKNEKEHAQLSPSATDVLKSNVPMPINAAQGTLRKVGYLSLHTTGTEDFGRFIDSFDVTQYTDIILCWTNPNASGNFTITSSMSLAITKAHNQGIKVWAGIATNTNNSDANNQVNNNRANFISNIRRFLTDNNFDGIDLDFEGGGLTANFSPFVVQLNDTLQLYSKKLSAAIARWQANSISAAAYGRLTYLNVMCYDHRVSNGNPQPHSAFSDFVTDINVFGAKIAKSKINMGIPAYAWVYENGTPTTQIGYNSVARYVPYGYCINAQNPTPTKKWFYDGFPAIRTKIPYALQQGIGGIMIWHILADAIKDDEVNLIRFINYCDANPSGFYPGVNALTNTNSGLALQIAGGSNANGAAAVQGNGDAQGTHLWNVTFVSNGNYGLLNNYSGKALDVTGASTASGAPFAQWGWWNQAQNQLFKLASDDLGHYTLTVQHSNMRVQIAGASGTAGAQVVQGPADGSFNQKWMIWR